VVVPLVLRGSLANHHTLRQMHIAVDDRPLDAANAVPCPDRSKEMASHVAFLLGIAALRVMRWSAPQKGVHALLRLLALKSVMPRP
jgi:hypothetical protein